MTESALVDDFRKEHRDELERSLAVLISIRDGDGKDKDRIDAAVAIAKLLGAVTDVKNKKAAAVLEKPELKRGAKSEIDAYIDAL